MFIRKVLLFFIRNNLLHGLSMHPNRIFPFKLFVSQSIHTGYWVLCLRFYLKELFPSIRIHILSLFQFFRFQFYVDHLKAIEIVLIPTIYCFQFSKNEIISFVNFNRPRTTSIFMTATSIVHTIS